MAVSDLRRHCALLAIVASIATPFGIASAQAIAHSRNVTSMLVSAAEDSSSHTVPALLDRLSITALQVHQIRVTAAQHRSQREPIVEQMLSAQAADNSSGVQSNGGMFLQRLQELDLAQEADIEAILTPIQLKLLKELAPKGTIVIPRTPETSVQS